MRTGDAIVAVGTSSPRVTFRPGVTSFALGTLRASRASRASVPLVTFRSLGTSSARIAGFALRTLRTSCTGIALVSLRAGLALDALRPLFASIALVAFGAGRAGVSLVALRSLGDVCRGRAILVGDGDGSAFSGLRDGRRGAEPVRSVLAVGPVEVTALRRRLDALGNRRRIARRVVGGSGSRIGGSCGIGRDLGGVLVGVDGVPTITESVSVLGIR